MIVVGFLISVAGGYFCEPLVLRIVRGLRSKLREWAEREQASIGLRMEATRAELEATNERIDRLRRAIEDQKAYHRLCDAYAREAYVMKKLIQDDVS